MRMRPQRRRGRWQSQRRQSRSLLGSKPNFHLRTLTVYHQCRPIISDRSLRLSLHTFKSRARSSSVFSSLCLLHTYLVGVQGFNASRLVITQAGRLVLSHIPLHIWITEWCHNRSFKGRFTTQFVVVWEERLRSSCLYLTFYTTRPLTLDYARLHSTPLHSTPLHSTPSTLDTSPPRSFRL